MAQDDKPNWWVFNGKGTPEARLARLPDAPPWRRFDDASRAARGKRFIPRDEESALVNAALYLRRPLLITGKPGVGKTSLTYAVAEDLGLGHVLRWSITTRTTLRDGLYRYDAIARLQDTSLQEPQAQPSARGAQGPQEPQLRPGAAAQSPKQGPDAPPIGNYLRLGPLGTAFAASEPKRPRVLLIDEIDKSDIDLPNDLLHIFEEGEFEIPELARLPEDQVQILPHDAPAGAKVAQRGIPVERGRVRCRAFPLVVMTSNAEREFPPAFLRRCLKLDMAVPKRDELKNIVLAHLFPPGSQDEARYPELENRIVDLLDNFLSCRDKKNHELAADQLLNAVYMVLQDADPTQGYKGKTALLDMLWRSLSE